MKDFNFDFKKYKKGNLDFSETNISELPENLIVRGSLDLNFCSELKRLPDNLTVEQDLMFFGSNLELGNGSDIFNLWLPDHVKKLPKNLVIGNKIYISKFSQLENCVHNMGQFKRSAVAYNLQNQKVVIRLGCFIGILEECIEAVSQKYSGIEKVEYLNKIKKCFDLYE